MVSLLGIGATALRNWKLILGGLALAAALLWGAFGHMNARHFEKKYDNEHKRSAQLALALDTTVKNHRAAAAEAQRQAEANVARVKSEQSKITEEVSRDYQARLAAARARYERLRSGTPATNPGRPGEAGLPGSGAAPGGPDAPAGENRLPPADALICTEQAIQLEELQAWVRRQSQVSTEAAQ